MPGNVFVKILTPGGNWEEVVSYNSVVYNVNMSGVGSFSIVLNSSDYVFSKFQTYKKSNSDGNEQGLVKFYKGSRLEFRGKISNIKLGTSGGYVITGIDAASGFLNELQMDANSVSATSIYIRSAEDPETRLLAWLGEVYKVTGTAGTINFSAGNATEKNYLRFQTYGAIKDLVLAEKFNEFYFEYAPLAADSDTMYVEERLGSTDSIFTFVGGVDYKVLNHNSTVPAVNSCTVEGGWSSTEGRYATGYYPDPTSVGTNNKIHKSIVDRSITDDGECLIKATNYVNNNKNGQQYITLSNIINVDLVSEPSATSPRTSGSFGLGDTITVTDANNNLESASLRIIGFVRTINKNRDETLSFKTLVSSIKLTNNGDVISFNQSRVAGGSIAGAAQDVTTANTSSEVDAGGGVLSVLVTNSTFSGTIAYQGSNDYSNDIDVGANHTSMVIITYVFEVHCSTTPSQGDILLLRVKEDGTGSGIGNDHLFLFYYMNHTHTGGSHTHTGPSHNHSGTGANSQVSNPTVDADFALHAHTIAADGTGNTGTPSSSTSGNQSPFIRNYTATVIVPGDWYNKTLNLELSAGSMSVAINYSGIYNAIYVPLHNHSVSTTNIQHTTSKGTLYVEGS